MYDRRVWSLSQGISAIDSEFLARRKEAKARREQREARKVEQERRRADRKAQPAAAPSDPTGGALARWFSQMLTQPLGITTQRVEFTWELQGRHYYATYAATDRALAVWVQVKPGTPDATSIGDGHFMPANNRRELGRALDAEKRARGSPSPRPSRSNTTP